MENKEIQQMTRGKAIRKYCLDCSGGKPREVTRCPFPECPLYGFRFGKGVGPKWRVIRNYCVKHCMNDQPVEVKICTSPQCALFRYRMGNEKKGEQNGER